MAEPDAGPGPAEVAAAYLPPGAVVTAAGVPVSPPDRCLGWYVTVTGSLLRPAGGPGVRWCPAAGVLCPGAATLSGLAVWSAAAEYLACAARAGAGPAAVYVAYAGDPLDAVALRIGKGSPLGPAGGPLLVRALDAAARDPAVAAAAVAAVAGRAGTGSRAALLSVYSRELRGALRPLVRALIGGRPPAAAAGPG